MTHIRKRWLTLPLWWSVCHDVLLLCYDGSRLAYAYTCGGELLSVKRYVQPSIIAGQKRLRDYGRDSAHT